jgi:hypothetical protein
MWYPDDVQHLKALSEHVSRWVLRWAHGHRYRDQGLHGRDWSLHAGG